MIKYPYSKQNITKKDINAVTRALKSRYITQGTEVENLEKELGEVMGSKFAIIVNSGTAALHISYHILGVDKDNGVITSPITFLSTANAGALLNSPVYFTDVDHKTGLMTCDTLSDSLETIKSNIGLVVPVHLAGRACDMVGINKEARKRGMHIVEDASHAPLAEYSNNKGNKYKVGACKHSDITIMSLHAIKHIAMGEGGVILTNNKSYADKAKRLRSHGIIRDSKLWTGIAAEKNAPWYYEMQDIGWNYRATEMQCALGRSQLSLIHKSLYKRNIIANKYNKLLSNIDGISLPCRSLNNENHSYHLYAIAIDFDVLKKTRISIINALLKKGIGTQVHYIPLFFQPYYSTDMNNYPGAVKYYNSTLSIPMYIGLKTEDIKYISNAIINVIYE